MSEANQLVVSRRNIVVVALTAFGGMVTAMLATLAITIPVMSAQAESQLDRQARQFAQVISTQAQLGTAKQAAADFDIPAGDPCIEPSEGAVQQPAKREAKVVEAKAPVVLQKVAQPKAKAAPAVVHKKEAPKEHVKSVEAKKVVTNNTTNNTYNDNSVHAVNSFNSVSVEGKKNDVDVNIGSKNTQVNVDKDKVEHHSKKKDDKKQQESKVGHGKSHQKPGHSEKSDQKDDKGDSSSGSQDGYDQQ